MPGSRRRRPVHYARPTIRHKQSAEKPHVPTPVRAWCISQVDEASYLPPRQRDDTVAAPGEWSMFLEDGTANETFTGALSELIELARRRGAEEIYQWSPVERTYVPLAKAD